MAECEGYRAIAQFLAKEPGIVILNRFPTLNVQNLLYMQAELYHLEEELQEIAKEDAASSCPTRQDYRYSFVELRDSLAGPENFQWKKILDIRHKLEQYSEYIENRAINVYTESGSNWAACYRRSYSPLQQSQYPTSTAQVRALELETEEATDSPSREFEPLLSEMGCHGRPSRY